MANYGGSPGAPYNMPPPPQRPSPPASVLTAVKLMYAGAALSVISLIIGLTQRDAIQKAVVANNPSYTAGEINTAANFLLVFGAVVGIIGLGLWLWMASANKKGQTWARVVSTVLFGLNTLFLVFITVGAAYVTIQKILVALIWLVGLGAVVFLWRSDSSAYFNAP
jgi:asparagine N-glycosylation enzyme membrane subunit Stt3